LLLLLHVMDSIVTALQPTSALDQISEAIVSEAVSRLCVSGGNKTTLTVAHRLRTIQDSNIIFVLERGQLKEQGTHVELMAKGGTYAHLVLAQSNSSSI
jgi:ABC-type multidrug transport system fused ATPase/permease subunit